MDQPLHVDAICLLPDDAAHHIAHVLRMKTGQQIVLFNGHGGQYDAEILRINKRTVEVQVIAHLDEERESHLDITLAQGISRGQHMDYTLQKAVELGVKQIVPVFSEHSSVRLNRDRQEKRYQHWRRIIISACEQCGRNRLPVLTHPKTLADWLDDDNNDLKIILHPVTTSRLSQLDKPRHSLTLLAGPEGGFADNEIILAQQKGYQPVVLGPRILRTETAALVAISACQALWGDMC